MVGNKLPLKWFKQSYICINIYKYVLCIFSFQSRNFSLAFGAAESVGIPCSLVSVCSFYDRLLEQLGRNLRGNWLAEIHLDTAIQMEVIKVVSRFQVISLTLVFHLLKTRTFGDNYYGLYYSWDALHIIKSTVKCQNWTDTSQIVTHGPDVGRDVWMVIWLSPCICLQICIFFISLYCFVFCDHWMF